MRRTFLFAAVTFALLAAVFSFARAREESEGRVNVAPSWEYRLLMLTNVVNTQTALREPAKAVTDMESKFNELGREGWEYCEISNGIVVFKRPKRHLTAIRSRMTSLSKSPGIFSRSFL